MTKYILTDLKYAQMLTRRIFRNKPYYFLCCS